jgi:mono/diheme cytochrome c family protein
VSPAGAGLLAAAVAAALVGCNVNARPPPLAAPPSPSPEELIRTGRAVFTAKCWGCHHENVLAFGPSFQWIGRYRPEPLIRAQIRDPKATSAMLGYPRSAMPTIPLTDAEVDGVVALIRRVGQEGDTCCG